MALGAATWKVSKILRGPGESAIGEFLNLVWFRNSATDKAKGIKRFMIFLECSFLHVTGCSVPVFKMLGEGCPTVICDDVVVFILCDCPYDLSE